MKKQVQVYYKGNVHGVGFRYTAENLSNKYPITGFVRNNPDREVEIIAEGEEEDLKGFLSSVNSSMKNYIQKVSENWMDYGGTYEDFRIAYQ